MADPIIPELKIAALPKHGSWRVSWFGQVSFPNRTLRSKHPSIEVRLSRITAENWREDPSVLLNPESVARQTRSCWVSVGTLALIRIGDIWTDKTWAASPSYEFDYFKNLEIGPETVQLTKVGIDDGGNFLLPFAEHPWHSDDTHSYCVIVQLPHSRRMVIPCAELVRFYFGSSSPLLHKIFAPPLQKEALAPAWSWGYNRKLTLTLPDGVTEASGRHIARIVTEEPAWRAAAMVGSSCLRSSALRESIYPQTIFPFVGETTLGASGKWLSFGDQPRSTFLVYSLRSCSARFEWSALECLDTSGRPAPKRRSDLNGENKTQSPERRKPQDRVNRLVELDGASKYTPNTFYHDRGDRFIGLIGKPSWTTKVIGPKERSPSNPDAQPVTEGGIGESAGDARVRSINIVDLEGRPRPRKPAFLRVALPALYSLEDVVIELLTASNDDGWSVPLELLADEDGVLPDALALPGQEAGTSLRACSAFKVSHLDRKIVLVVLDGNPPEVVLGEIFHESFEALGSTIHGALGCNNHVGRALVEEKGQFAAWLRERLQSLPVTSPEALSDELNAVT